MKDTEGKLPFNCVDIPTQYFMNAISPHLSPNMEGIKELMAGKGGKVDDLRLRALALGPKDQVPETMERISSKVVMP